VSIWHTKGNSRREPRERDRARGKVVVRLNSGEDGRIGFEKGGR